MTTAMAPYPRSYSSPTAMSFLTLSSIFLFLSTSASSDPSPTVYEILSKFGLPSGLLPSSVQSYTLADDGTFSVQLDNPCYIQFDYLVYYDKSITGKLRYGSITDLKGIQVQKLWLWLGVGEIKVDLPPSDSIYFQVGVINKKLDIDQFNTVRGCRNSNGLSCATSFRSIFKVQVQLPAPVREEISMRLTE